MLLDSDRVDWCYSVAIGGLVLLDSNCCAGLMVSSGSDYCAYCVRLMVSSGSDYCIRLEVLSGSDQKSEGSVRGVS